MTYLTKAITRLLNQAASEQSVIPLKEAFNQLRGYKEENMIVVDEARGHAMPHDLYLFCCETALYLEEWATAKHCLDRLMEGTQSTTAHKVRTLFCRGVLESHESQGLRCQPLIAATSSALAKILRGIKIALQEPTRYAYLVAMGAEHVWNVGRILYKQGTFEEVVAPIAFVVQSLEKIEHTDQKLRIVWMLRQATALIGANRAADANTLLTKTAEQATKNVPAFKYVILRMQVSLSKLVANQKLKSDAARSTPRAVYAAQCLFCGILEGQPLEQELLGAFADLEAEFRVEADPQSASPSKGKAEKAAPPAKSGGKNDPSSQGPPPPQVDEVASREDAYAELGLALALNNQIDQATEACRKAASMKSLRARVFAEYTQGQLQATKCGGMATQSEIHSNFFTTDMNTELVAAIRRVERAIESAARIADSSDRNHVVQLGCILIWNMSLPLLQPSTRHIIARSLMSAAKYLDDIGSNLNRLRALLHYEAGLTDMDAEYLNKATTRVSKALALDYFADPEQQQLYALQRPLDRYFVWTKRRLDTKSNMYAKHQQAEDEALLILEQARDAPLMSRFSMLQRASDVLAASEPPAAFGAEEPPPQETPANGGAKGAKAEKKKGKANAEAETPSVMIDPDVEVKRNLLRDRSHLWHMVLTYAWKERSPMMIDMVRRAAGFLSDRSWVRRGDRDMRLLQADAEMKLADTYVAGLDAKGLQVAQRRFDEDRMEGTAADEDEDAIEVEEEEEDAEFEGEGMELAAGGDPFAADNEYSLLRERIESVAEAQRCLQQHLIAAAAIGVELVGKGWPDQWVVMNAATMLWNYHTDAFEDKDFLSAAPGLESLYGMLMNLQLDPTKETALIRDIGLAYVRSLIQLYVKEKLNLDDSVSNSLRVTGQDIYEVTLTDPNNARLAKASEVCEKLITTLPTPMDAIQFAMASANIRRLQAKPVDPRVHPQLKLMGLLDQQLHPGPSMDDKRNAINAGFELLQQDPNIELCARLAERSLAVTGCERTTVRIAAVGGKLYKDGKLGWKQLPVAAQTQASPGKQAKGKEKATSADTPPPSVEIPDPAAEDWTWYALLLQFQGLATASLIDPSVQDKTTQNEVRRQALVALANSAQAAMQGSTQYRSSTVIKALRHYFYICREFASDATSRDIAFDSLAQLLSPKVISAISIAPMRPTAAKKAGGATRETDGEVVSYLFLFLLRCLRDQHRVEAGLETMKLAIKVLPAALHKPFWDLDVQLRCEAGLPTNQTLLRIKEYGPETQAQVWVTLARHAQAYSDQLYAFQSAIDVLQGSPVVQAEYMLAMVQWMLQANADVSLDHVRTTVLAAVDLLGDTLDQEGDDLEGFSDLASSAAGRTRASGGSRSGSIARRSSAGSITSDRRSVTMTVRTGASRATARRERPRPTVAQLRVAVQAYYLLAKLATPNAVCDGIPVDARAALELAVHYILRMWASTVSVVNNHHARARARQAREESRKRALSNAGAEASTAITPDPKKEDAPPPKPAKGGKKAPPQPTGEIPQQKAPEKIPDPVQVPDTIQGWLGFQIPEELPTALRKMQTPYALAPGVLEAPDTFLSVLSDMVEMLVAERLEVQAQVVLALQGLIIEVFFPSAAAISDAASKAITMRSWSLQESVGAGAVASLVRITDPQTSAADRAALLEDARTVASRRNNDTGLGSPPSSASAKRVVVKPAGHRFVHRYWLASSALLIAEGRFSVARSLLTEAMVHARAHDDSESIAKGTFLEARLLAAEGSTEQALTLVKTSAELIRNFDGYAWLTHRIFEAGLLIQSGKLDEAFAVESNAQQTLALQMLGCHNLQSEVAGAVVPRMQAVLSIKFTSLIAAALRQSIELGGTQNTQLLRAFTVLTDQVTERADRSGDALSASLLQLELRHLTDIVAAQKRSPSDARKSLLEEGAALEATIALVRSGSTNYLSSSSTTLTELHSDKDTEAARVLTMAGRNLLERVATRAALVDAYRASNVTQIAYPMVDGAPKELETELVMFMRSSRKQREAATHIKERAAERRRIEALRDDARKNKQAEVEARREQRRAEAEANAPAKGAKAPKKGPSGLDLTELADVEPNDKCGIASPDASDDDGNGEDSQSEEEVEVVLANNAVREDNRASNSSVDPATLSEAFVVFQEAHQRAKPGSIEAIEASLGLAVCMRAQHEASAVGFEQRQALLKGVPPPPLVRSETTDALWTAEVKPLESPSADAGDRRGKKEDLKKAKGQPAVAPVAASPEPVVAKPPAPGLSPERLLQACAILEECIKTAHQRLDSFATQADLYAEYAKSCVAVSQPMNGAKAVEAAVACRSAHRALTVWDHVSHSDAHEVVLYRAFRELRQKAPEQYRSPQGIAVLRALLSNSRMLNRLRVPDATVGSLNASAGTDEVPVAHNNYDVAVLSILKDGSNLIAAIRRPTGQAHVQRKSVDIEALRNLTKLSTEYQAKRLQTLSGDNAAGDDTAAEVMWSEIVEATSAILDPLLAPITPPHLHRHQLVLCIDPESGLLPIPVEAAESLQPFKVSSRDLSAFAVQNRLGRRGQEKFAANQATLLLDTHQEAQSLYDVVVDEGKVKQSGWAVHTCINDDAGFARPLAVSAMQRLLRQPNASTTIVANTGRFANSMPLQDMSTLPLEHIRVWAMLDRVTNGASTRRENQSNMAKSSSLQWCESPWNVALLLLARGIECAVVNQGPIGPRTGEQFLRVVSGNLDKSQPKNFAEIIGASVRSENVELNESRNRRASTTSAPALALNGGDRWNLYVYGMSPDDGAKPTK